MEKKTQLTGKNLRSKFVTTLLVKFLLSTEFYSGSMQRTANGRYAKMREEMLK